MWVYKTIRHGKGLQLRLAALLVASLFAGLFALSSDTATEAATTLPTKMNFQGRVTNSAGNVLANGTYNMRFRIYNALTGGSTVWTEDRLVSATQGVQVTNGQFNVQLGSLSGNPLPASIFTSNSLYFEVELPTPATATTSSPSWTEGAMTPRNQLATSAYAYNAETLDGIDSDAFAQLGTGNTFMNAQNVNVSNANAFQVRNGSTNLFNVSTSTNTVSVGTSDTTGALLVLDTKTDSGDPTGTNGAMYYNSNANKFRCYQGSTWVDCITTNTPTSLQGAYDADVSGVADIVTTSASKGVQIKAGSGFDQGALFDIQDSGTISLFTVDSTNDRVYIGDAVGDATGVVLVLDTKNSTGDPTGINGAMYYNSSLAKFRCYQDNEWINCTTGQVTIMKSSAQNATASSTTFQNVTDMTFNVLANASYAFEMVIPINVSNITADAKYTITIPTNATITATGSAATATTTGATCAIQTSGQTCTIAVGTAIRTAIAIDGVINVGSTAGTTTLQFAQNTSTAASTPTILQGAKLRYEKL